jgi:hypothetical protein
MAAFIFNWTPRFSPLLLLSAFLFCPLASAQEHRTFTVPFHTSARAGPPDSPTLADPKPMLIRRHAFWHLDRDVLGLLAVQGTAELADGIGTRRSPYAEDDPIARAFLGRDPQWSRMIPLGIAEAYGCALVAQRMKHSQHQALRVLYPVPQLFASGAHAWSAHANFEVKP